MKVVVSQSMYFPWVGLLEQVRCSDAFVHYDDVQFARGFGNRVQIKAESGTRWMTVPLRKHTQSARIDELVVDDSQDWRSSHLNNFRACYRKAPFFEEAHAVMESVLKTDSSRLSDISRASILALARYFGLDEGRRFLDSSQLQAPGRSTERLVNICVSLGASTYITGHGASGYLDHARFEACGIDVSYMAYEKLPYPQLHGPFTPYVTGLDLIANCGRAGAQVISSGTVPWRRFIDGSH